ncbi:unnamed protein product [Nesidiocoris tenuis]|uniref:DH domain-containing protein n=1 Tax=Nesidiocoris tenuis TaxID=355587 RepID=A0A6H5G9F1_9HEMI|nr:unnamed protein product [Nesidiocoris tenuis]
MIRPGDCTDGCWGRGPTGYVRIGSVRVRVRSPSSSSDAAAEPPEFSGCCLSRKAKGLPPPGPASRNRTDGAAAVSRSWTSGARSVRGSVALDRHAKPPAPLEPPPRRRPSTRQEKAERLKELTEKLKEPAKIQTENSQLENFPTTSNFQNDPFDFNLELPKVESRAIIGAYIQRTIPFRSASFSQVDYSSTDGKYNIRPARTAKPSSSSLPRKKTSEPSNVGGSPAEFPPGESNGLDADSLPPPAKNVSARAKKLSDSIEEETVESVKSAADPINSLQISPTNKSENNVNNNNGNNLKRQKSVSSSSENLEKSVVGRRINDWSGGSAPQSPDEAASPPLWRLFDDRLSRAGSLSEGESDNGGPAYPPRSYSKRPLRGPYGQMLEAEMKKPERKADELKKRPPDVRRKVSANLGEVSEKVEVHHQRTTSSPSQLEGCSTTASVQLLAHLLKGSSERALTESDPARILINSPAFWKDTRTHVVVELYETEKSYVESLQILVMIPEILAHHELFLEELRKRLENWDINQKIGDVILDTFTKPSVIETYSAFINNWETAYETIKSSMQSKPAFAKFVETTAKEHKGKLSLDSLLIMPVQRIPRYELLIQTLLKHTESCHSDARLLIDAQHGIHDLATTINFGRHATSLNTRSSTCHELAQLETIIEGLAGGLTSPDRTFLCHDQVSITTAMGRKDRALFLFSDLLLIASMKRRSGTIKKVPQNVPGSLMHALEGNRFKLLMKIPLGDLEIVKDDNVRKMLKEMEQLNADVSTLSQMAELVTSLHCPHSQLEENIREMLSALNNQLTERHAADSQLSYLELNINTPSGTENIALIFSKPEKRTLWEETFSDAKQRLALSGHQRALPELMSAVPIRKTRAGLQFTCAAPTYGPGLRDVWVCNSDGYVGQVCVLSLHPEPTVTSCNGVCNARILCIAPVPGSSSSDDDEHPEEENELTEMGEDISSGTMWLGTEDGCIHVYNCTDNIRTKKNKIKIQHNAPVHCIIYLDNRVYVALANGDLSMYCREPNGGWNTNDVLTMTVGSAATPVTKIVPITGQLWCTCHTSVKILNTASLEILNSFTVCESNRAITSMANSGYSVWIALQNSSSIRLFHAATCESLGEVNIAPAVTKMLASSDDIIRQHKSACLRVTSLLACKDLLWIGTSAGVILTMPLPHIMPNTTKLSTPLNVAGVPHGHTGHVRFLTTVDLSLNGGGETAKRKSAVYNRRKLPKLLVISGGDGYEDFRSAGVAEMAGREDSTNHLLLWHV